MRSTRKENRELVQAIIGGEMRNAWQPTVPGEARDERPADQKRTWERASCRDRFRANYDQIVWDR